MGLCKIRKESVSVCVCECACVWGSACKPGIKGTG